MLKWTALLICVLAVFFNANADNLQTGEWAVLDNGTPAKIGQPTQDHIFVRGSYNEMGEMAVYDNLVSFRSDSLQTVWLWLDDDMIYLNSKVQALPPTLIKDNGAPYNEITYNSLQLNIYLPEGIQMVKCEDEEGNEVSFVQGDRLPNSAIFKFAADTVTKEIDGIVYHPYTLIIANMELNGTHFSSRNASAYQHNGALTKDDAPLVGIFLKNTNQSEHEGRLADMIIANQEFSMIEPMIVEPCWEPNDYRFIYGEGGNNQTQRYQRYNRVELYGSKGFGNNDIEVTHLSLDYSSKVMKAGETFQLTATVLPDNATNKTLAWTSSNPSVATVDDEGLVTAVASGSATVTASTTDGSNLSATCAVSVYVPASAISLNTDNLTLEVDETSQLVATISPSNTSNKKVSWKSSDLSVVTVTNSGLVKAVAPGTATVTAMTTDGTGLTASCTVEVISVYYVTLDTLSHVRGSAAQVVDLPVSLVNKNPISAIQFNVSLPADVSFNLVDGKPDIWLDEARGTSEHSVSSAPMGTGKYRVSVTSSPLTDLIGSDGALVHMNMLLPQLHDSGDRTIDISRIIAFEADGTTHMLENASTLVHFYYLVGDADANAMIDVADYNATASKILGKNPAPFYSDAANVDANSSIDMVDLVGITNIALEIDPTTVRKAPVMGTQENRLFCDKLQLNADGEAVVNLGLDCGFHFAGFQMDVDLPHGLTLVGATLGEQASAFGLATEEMPSGRIRILGSTFSVAEVSGQCPQLLRLKVKADGSYLHGSNIEFSDVLFAERDLTGHIFDGSSIEYVEPSAVFELMDEPSIYVENGNIIVDTSVSGTVQLITADGRMIERQALSGHNVYTVDASGILIVHFNGKVIKVRL